MKNTTAATRYAKALLDLAIEQKKLDAVQGDMNFFLETCKDSRDMELLLSSPVVGIDKKITIISLVFEQFEELTHAFMKLIIRNRRENILIEIAEAFDKLAKTHKGIFPLTLVSATELSASSKEQILSKVSALIHGTPEVTELIDESLIGGFIVKMGDTQIDASVKSQLNNLKQTLIN